MVGILMLLLSFQLRSRRIRLPTLFGTCVNVFIFYWPAHALQKMLMDFFQWICFFCMKGICLGSDIAWTQCNGPAQCWLLGTSPASNTNTLVSTLHAREGNILFPTIEQCRICHIWYLKVPGMEPLWIRKTDLYMEPWPNPDFVSHPLTCSMHVCHLSF